MHIKQFAVADVRSQYDRRLRLWHVPGKVYQSTTHAPPGDVSERHCVAQHTDLRLSIPHNTLVHLRPTKPVNRKTTVSVVADLKMRLNRLDDDRWGESLRTFLAVKTLLQRMSS